MSVPADAMSMISEYSSDRQLGLEIIEEIEEFAIKMEKAHPPQPQRSLARSIGIVATCTGAMVVNISNSTTVTISLPAIGAALNLPEDQLQWLLSAYALSSACLLLFFGRLCDLYGRKKGFLIGMLWQMVFAIGLGFAKTGITLDILRGLQGMGAAAAMPAALGILAHSFPPSRARSTAFATFAAGAPVGGAFGTIMGGVLTQISGDHWRAPFFLSAGLSALCAMGALASFGPDILPTDIDRRVDWVGAFLVTTGLSLIVFVLGQAPSVGWKTPYIIACLVVGVILVVVFLLWEHRLENFSTSPGKPQSFWTPPPLMKVSIWARARGRMAAILVVAFLNWSGFMSWAFWAQLYYQNYLKLTPLNTMVRFLPMFVMGCVCNFLVALLVARLPLVIFVMLGTLITGIACVLFALVNPSATYWAYEFPSTTLVVCGADFVFAAGTIFVAKIVLSYEQSLAGGLFQTMTQLGTAFGLTITTIVFNSVLDTQSAKLGVVVNSTQNNAPLSAQLDAYRAAQWTSAAFPFLAAVIAALFLRGVGVVGHKKPPRPEDPSEQTITEQHAAGEP